MGKGLETLKNITKDKNKEKLIYILLAAVVILIASSYIFNEEEESKTVSTNTENYIYTVNDLEERLSNILCKIDGISNVSCFITYKDQGTVVPVYSESKEVIYTQTSNQKQVLIEKTLSPTIEGVIIVGSGMGSQEMQTKIATAVASVMNIGVYKVQVFNKEVVS